MSELHTEIVGDGDRVVLVHGSLATGTEEWSAQQPLADEGFRLVIADRRGYGLNPRADGEDFVRDADDIIGLLDGFTGAPINEMLLDLWRTTPKP